MRPKFGGAVPEFARILNVKLATRVIVYTNINWKFQGEVLIITVPHFIHDLILNIMKMFLKFK